MKKSALCSPLLWRTLVISLALSPGLTAQVRFNEFLFLNDRTNTDEEGDTSDWLELYNAGQTPVNLVGHGLSDDPRRPNKWVFPDFELAAGAYLLVWCSGKDRTEPARDIVLERNSPVPFAATIIDLNAEWRYTFGSTADADAGLPLPEGWSDPAFDDGNWAVGRPGFGFGDDDDTTELPSNIGAVLLRHRFRVTERQLAQPLYLQADFDDGFVLFLNGTRLLNVHFDAEEPLHFGSLSNRTREARGSPDRWELDEYRDHFDPEGENVIAVALLNKTQASNDLSFLPELGTVPPVFHTNFELASAGEQLLLTDPESVLLDAVNVPVQNSDRSYGRVSPGEGAFVYFLTPSPGEENAGPFSPEPISTRPDILPAGGEYDGPVTVEIAAAFPFADVEIRYTTNGADPRSSSELYEGPFELSRSRMIRAAAFRGGEQISRVATSSYFLNAARYDLPILSIAMEPQVFSELHQASGARGRVSEKEGHLEVVTAGGDVAVSTGMGLRLHGGAGRQGGMSIKKAYKMYFRGIYGDRKLRYGVIPETDVDVFDKLVLRSNFNDAFRTGQEASLIRDELIRDLHEDMGYVVSHGAWYNVFINMQYRGVYNVVERMDKDFFYSYFPEDGPDGWFVVKTGDDVLDGGADATIAWREVQAFFGSSRASDEWMAAAAELIDVENYTSYMILNMWAQNHDWPHNNWYAARPRREGGRWIFLSWDAEFGIGKNPGGFNANTLQHILDRRGSSIGRIIGGLLSNVGYQRYFVDEVERHLNDVLSPEHVLARIDELVAVVEQDIPEEATLPSPSGGFSVGTWRNNIRAMQTFARGRPAVVRRFVFESGSISLPRVTSVSPRRVTFEGEEIAVELSGYGLTEGTRAFFDGIPGSPLESVSSRRFRTTLPFDLAIEGKPVITVETSDGLEGLAAHDLLEVRFVRPSASIIVPAQGSVHGGDVVLVTGENLTGETRVEFGGVPAPSVELVDPTGTAVRVVTPPGAAGPVEVRVINTRPGDLPAETPLEFTYLPSDEAIFRRGDADGDGRTGMPDAIGVFGFLFAGRTVSCEDALDADDSGRVDLTDGLYVLDYLFSAGAPPPPAPFPACGVDPSSDGLSCASADGCSG